MTPAQLESIRREVFERPAGPTICYPSVLPEDVPLPPAPLTLERIFTHSPLAILAEVERVEPGWSPAYRRVESLVYARVVEVLRDDVDALDVGDRFTFLDPDGWLPVPSGRLCTAKPEGVYVPLRGETFALVEQPEAGSAQPVPLRPCATCVYAVEATKDGLVIQPTICRGLLRPLCRSLRSCRRRGADHEAPGRRPRPRARSRELHGAIDER